MKNLVEEGNTKTPKMSFDFEKGYLEITGRSIHENAWQFYKPFIAWIKEYAAKPKTKSTTLFVKLEYSNSSSSKYLLEILQVLDKLASQGHPVIFKWHYDTNDEDLEEMGKDLASFLKFVKTDFVPYKK